MDKQTDVEILIHIGAPTREVDDAKYRRFATSYRDFNPSKYFPISYTSEALAPAFAHKERNGKLSIGSCDLPTALPNDETHSSPQSVEHLSVLKSPTASFASVIDNASSPLLRLRKLPSGSEFDHLTGPLQNCQSKDTQSTWQSFPSIVEDSIPFNHAAATDHPSPTRVLENYLQTFGSSSQSNRCGTNGSPLVISNTPPRPNDTAPWRNSQPTRHPTTPGGASTILVVDSAAVSLVGSESKRFASDTSPYTRISPQPGAQGSDDIVEETTLISSSDVNSLVKTDSETVPVTRPRQSIVSGSTPGLLRTISDLGPTTSSRRPVITVAFLPCHGFSFESLQITAPEPPVSTRIIEPHNLITESLEKLARDLDLDKRFRPEQQLRDLRPSERGYWLLNCSSWSIQLKWDAWAFLANHVGTGLTGWGVSCKRDAEYQSLKVFCWGAVVPHIYLLLYLATQREVLFTGAYWIEGGGEKVVVMGKTENRDEQSIGGNQ
ncbi:hypothetical protein F5Y15DRAFT_18228 [Xylariaceae sp. FL0016]|nr:hypothetical protein F5Y15DRAFT_18228 [Xylariaceae sp. FL0016]